MNKALKILLITVCAIILLILVFFLFLLWASKQPAVKENYFENVTTKQPLEQKYTSKGSYAVSCISYEVGSKKTGQFKIWYPSEMEISPL